MPIDEPRMSAGGVALSGVLPDVAANDPNAPAYFVSPITGWIKEVHVVTVDTTSGTDDTITVVTNLGTLGSSATLTTGTAPQQIELNFSQGDSNNYVQAGEAFSVESDGASTGTDLQANVTVVVEPY
jgi:hypothetical protein